MKLLPYQVQLGHYVLERIAAGDESMGQLSEPKRLAEALTAFIERGKTLQVGGKGRPPDDALELAEAATLMPILGLLFLSPEAWKDACSEVFLPLLLIHAGLRKVSICHINHIIMTVCGLTDLPWMHIHTHRQGRIKGLGRLPPDVDPGHLQ